MTQPSSRPRLGVDLGGTKTEIVALEPQGGELLRRREATPVGDYAATLQLIVRLVHETERALGERGTVGIGTPGAISPATGSIRNSNSTCLNGRPLHADLERLLGRRIAVANDANCFILSEVTDGAAAGARVAFGVILGTGVGGGIAVQGRVLEGANAIAGEWGHNPLPWPKDDERPGPACYCGKHGCVETWLSGPGLARDYEEHSQEKRSAEEIASLSLSGDRIARDAVERYFTRLARSLATVINVLDPDAIVLGGGLSNFEALYTATPGQWGKWIFSDTARTRLLRNRHGDSSGVRGAAIWGGMHHLEH